MGSDLVTIAAHQGSLAYLADAWDALNDPGHPGAPFRSYAWAASWWKHHSTSGQPFVLVARLADEIVGILPLYLRRTVLGGWRAQLMGDGAAGSDYLGVVARPEDAAPLARAFARHLEGAGLDEVVLDDLLDDDPLAEAAHGERTARYRCPLVRTRGSFSEYLESLPDGAGAQWHRRRKWLERRPGYALTCLSGPDGLAAGMEVLFDLHRRRWALEGGSDGIANPRLEAFHRDSALKLAQSGWARLWLLEVEGAPRAALYGFRHGPRFAYYQSGHDPDWRPRSVGKVLLGHVIRDCFESDIEEFDFLRGEEPYKWTWATGWRETVRLRLRGHGLRPFLGDELRAIEQGARATAHRILPTAAVAWLRTLRRRASG